MHFHAEIISFMEGFVKLDFQLIFLQIALNIELKNNERGLVLKVRIEI